MQAAGSRTDCDDLIGGGITPEFIEEGAQARIQNLTLDKADASLKKRGQFVVSRKYERVSSQ